MKIYMSGSIYGGTQKIETYKILINNLKKYGEILNDNIANENTIAEEAFQKDEDIFADLVDKMHTADIVFSEVSIPSLGVGYELGLADSLDKKIIAIYDKEYIDKVSTMIRGNKRIKLIPYHNLNEIIDNLEEIIK